MTAVLSVLADQDRVIWLDDTAVAERLVGVEGEVVSGVGVAERVTVVFAVAEP